MMQPQTPPVGSASAPRLFVAGPVGDDAKAVAQALFLARLRLRIQARIPTDPFDSF